jgi:tetratricopeptide (TPR) repeat protein
MKRAATFIIPGLLESARDLAVVPIVLCLLGIATLAFSQAAPDPKAVAVPNPISDVDLLILAGKLSAQRDFDAALAKYLQLLPAHPNWPKLYAGLARVYLQQGKIEDAADILRKGIDQADSPAVHVALGEVEFRQGKIFEAEQEWAKVINGGNEEARAYLGMARVSHANSMYKRYQALIDKAHDLDSQDSDIERSWNRIHRPRAVVENDCQLAGNATSAETPLVRLMYDATSPRGIGLSVEVDGAKSKLMLDTGASGILINQKIAEKAGIVKVSDTAIGGIGSQAAQASYQGIAKSIRIGQLEFHNCPVEVIQNRSVLGEDGLIGADVFESFLVEIDAPAGKLRLSALPQRPGAVEAPLSLRSEEGDPVVSSAGNQNGPQDRYIAPEMKSYTQVFRFGHDLLVPTGIGDAPRKLFLVDTGSSRSLLAPSAAREITRIHGEAFDTVKGLNGKVDKVYEAETVVFQFGHLRQRGRNVPTFDLSHISQNSGTEISGILGYIDILQYLDIKIDYRDGLADFNFTTAPINRPGCGPASFPCTR